MMLTALATRPTAAALPRRSAALALPAQFVRVLGDWLPMSVGHVTIGMYRGSAGGLQ
jgi:hypothetical protein